MKSHFIPIPDAAYMYLDNNVEIVCMEVYHFIDCHIIIMGQHDMGIVRDVTKSP